jgi:hypothetical protein
MNGLFNGVCHENDDIGICACQLDVHQTKRKGHQGKKETYSHSALMKTLPLFTALGIDCLETVINSLSIRTY